MEKQEKTLIIWLTNGQTMKFEKVTDFMTTKEDVGVEVIGFNYFGVSTKVARKAIFNLENIAGFALED
ncbi:hypothetical protein [Enterococcus olivae]